MKVVNQTALARALSPNYPVVYLVVRRYRQTPPFRDISLELLKIALTVLE
jgi:hypothetical protein